MTHLFDLLHAAEAADQRSNDVSDRGHLEIDVFAFRLLAQEAVKLLARDREQVRPKRRLAAKPVPRPNASRKRALDHIVGIGADLVLEKSVHAAKMPGEKRLARGRIAGSPPLEQLEIIVHPSA